MRSIVYALILFLVLTFLLSMPAHADGKAWSANKDDDRWMALRQNQQRAFLALDDGTEHMLIAIDVDLEQDDARGFWLFPVPGAPETVTIDLLDRFPITPGWDVIEAGRERLISSAVTEISVVINPILALLFLPALNRSSNMDSSALTIHSQIDKYGLRAEVITADSVDALSEFVAQRGASIPPEELALFESYLNNDYVLVATSIDSIKMLQAAFPEGVFSAAEGRQPALYVTFPTEQLFYPMRPTAGYGDAMISVHIATIGHMMPEGDVAMLAGATHHHYIQKQMRPELFPPGMRTAIKDDEPFYYSRFLFEGSAKLLTSDLTFVSKTKQFSAYQRFMGAEGFTGIPLIKFILLLFITGGVCGRLYLGEWWRPAFFGLLGVFSFAVVSHFTWRDCVISRGIRKPRGLSFAYAFTYLFLFIALDIVLTQFLLIPFQY